MIDDRVRPRHPGTARIRALRAHALPAGLLLAVACHGAPTPAPAPQVPPHEAFWESLHAVCRQAFAGRMLEGGVGDSLARRGPLVMHVSRCTPDEVRIPFHVGDDRSRTWVFTRTATGLRLKHDHRHEDGTPDPITNYGGDTRAPGGVARQEFNADAHTAMLIPAAHTNVWTVEIVPGRYFSYALHRVGTDRRFRVEFDLTRRVGEPPPPWGERR